MPSLEKKMFFLPSRLAIIRDRIYVSFALSSIPKDMDIKTMYLHIQLPVYRKATTIKVNRVTTTWSETSISEANRPALSKKSRAYKFIPLTSEQVIDVTHFKKNWRRVRRYNHGVCVQFKGKKTLQYIDNHPPFLVVGTE